MERDPNIGSGTLTAGFSVCGVRMNHTHSQTTRSLAWLQPSSQCRWWSRITNRSRSMNQVSLSSPGLKEKSNNKTRSYDSEGFTKRAGCLCFRSEQEEEVKSVVDTTVLDLESLLSAILARNQSRMEEFSSNHYLSTMLLKISRTAGPSLVGCKLLQKTTWVLQ